MTFPSPKQILDLHSLRPKHSFGQNFLSDPHLVGKIAALAAPHSDAVVLEIGAGLGALTFELLLRARRVAAVERDRELIPVLEQLFSDAIAGGSLSVIEADAKTLDWDAAASAQGERFAIAGNLPYQITGPLIEKTVRLARRIERAVFLVQKEVADRLAAGPGTKTYGALSVFVQAQFAVERALIIKAGAFYPPPRVDSAVVVFRPHETPASEETPEFRAVVKGAFLQRRKTLRNGWKNLCPPADLARLAQEVGISLDLRGETLSVEQFAKMTRAYSQYQRERSANR